MEARELIKGRVLDSCMDYTPRTAAETLAAATHSEVVQVIGSKFVLYRKKKEVPKKKPLSRPGQKSKADNRSERVDKAEKFGNRLERVRKAEKPGNRPAHVRKAEKPANSKARKPGNPARKTPSSGNRPAHVRKAEKPGNRPKRGDAPRRNHSATPKTRK